MATANTCSSDWDVLAYQNDLPRLLKHSEGKFALIRSAEVRTVHDTYDAAMDAGYAAYGDAAFLVKEILAADAPLLEVLRQTCHT
jgi:hypothetical protein